MALLKVREGKNQFMVLSYMCGREFAGDLPCKQVDIARDTSLTKGSVSNNVNELVDKDILAEESSEYNIVWSSLLKEYREHLESQLIRLPVRGPYSDRIERINKVCTHVKDDLEGILSEYHDVFKDLLVQVFMNSSSHDNIQTVREAFLKVDHMLVMMSENAEEEDIKLLGAVLDDRYRLLPDASSWENKSFVDKIIKDGDDTND